MPRINIDWVESGKTQELKNALAEKITQEVVTIGNAPPEKVIIAFIEHSPKNLYKAGNPVEDEVVRVYIEWVEDRKQEQRDMLAERITNSIVGIAGIKPEQITVKFNENEFGKFYKLGKIFKR